MENSFYNERRQISKIISQKIIKELNHKQKINLKNNTNIYINEITSSNESISKTASSYINSPSNFQFFREQKIKNEKNQNIPLKDEIQIKRRDNFGNEIKKGGKQKIAFIDDLEIIQSLIQLDNIKNKSKKGKNVKYSPSRIFIKKKLPKIKIIRRSHTFKSNHSFMMRNIYNISKKKINEKKNLEEHLVDVIKVESTKKENKLNTYSIKQVKNRINNEEEQVCCSCYCSIF